jgi:FixJ family two-component response regulator
LTKPIVYIVDDDEAVRDSIKELVQSVGMKAKIFDSALAVLEVLTTESAGCIVLDIRMTGMSGLGLQKRLGELNIELPLIFITGHGDIDMAVHAIKEGATDFIQKPYHEQNLLDSINAAMDENKKKKLHNQQIEQFNQHNAELTHREQEVMELLLKGWTNKLIGKTLRISPRTVEVHRQHIFEKFDVHSASQLMYLISQTTT